MDDLLEREIKWEVDERFVLPRIDDIVGGGNVEQATVELSSTYYDTADRDLQTHGVLLRRDDSGWPLEVPDERIEIHARSSVAPPSELTDMLTGLRLGKPLIDVATIRSVRDRYRITDLKRERLCAEVDVDRVQASVGHRLLAWWEIDVELGTAARSLPRLLAQRLEEAGAHKSGCSSGLPACSARSVTARCNGAGSIRHWRNGRRSWCSDPSPTESTASFSRCNCGRASVSPRPWTRPRYLDILAVLQRWRTDAPIASTATGKALNKRARRAGRKADRRLAAAVRTGDDALLHRARKTAKRARYAAELLAPVDNSKHAKRTVKQQADSAGSRGTSGLRRRVRYAAPPSGSFRPSLIDGLICSGGAVFSGGAGVLPNSRCWALLVSGWVRIGGL